MTELKTLQDIAPDHDWGMIEWGGTTLEYGRLPVSIALGMINRTYAHKLGNEVASQVIKVKEAADKAGTPLDDDDVDAKTGELRAEMLRKLLAGEVALGVGGARGSTLENIAFDLAMKEAATKLAPQGLWPMPDKKAGIKADEATVELGGKVMTRDDIAAFMLDKYRDRLIEEAKSVKAERDAKALAAKEAKAALPKTNGKADVELAELL